MSVTVTYTCDGCFAETTVRVQRPDWRALFSGRSYGFGGYPKYPSPTDTGPKAWAVQEPYTGCIYCPDCWAEVASGKEIPAGTARAQA